MAAFAEGMVLGQALGISQELLFKVLLGGPVVAPFVAMKREKLEHGNYEAEFPLKWMQKDLQMGAIAAYETGVVMPFGNVVKEVYCLGFVSLPFYSNNLSFAIAGVKNPPHINK